MNLLLSYMLGPKMGVSQKQNADASRYRSSQKGFTIIEMMVSLFIMAIITTAILLNYNRADSRIALANKANEIAIWLRQAQAYAMGIKTQGTSLYWSYGAYFNTTTQDYFTMYVDKWNSSGGTPANKLYDSQGTCGAADSECITQVPMPTGMKIDQLCVKAGTSPEDCSPTSVDISYTRPRSDAKIIANGNTATMYDQVRIRLKSPTGYCRRILVMNSGQVGVEDLKTFPCP